MRRSATSIAAISLGGLCLLAGCSGHGQHTSEGVAQSNNRLQGFKAGTEWDLATQQFMAGELDKALRSIDKSIGLNGSVAKSHVLRARILMEKGRLEDASESLKRALVIDPAHVEAHYYTGVLLERFSDYEGALAQYLGAHEQDQGVAQYLIAAAEMLAELDRMEEAETLLATRREYFAHNAGVRQTLGHLAMMQGRHQEAATHFSDARLLEPDDDGLTEDLARALVACGRYAEADAHLSRLVSRADDGTRRDLEHLRARCLSALGRNSEARAILLGLTKGEAGATDGQAWIALGQVAYAMGDMQRVRIAANRAIALAPSQPEGRLLLALWRRSNGDLNGALEMATEATRLHPGDSAARTIRGVLLRDLNRTDEAAQEFAAAMSMDPESTGAAAFLASVEAEE